VEPSIVGKEEEKAGCMENNGSGLQGISRRVFSYSLPLSNIKNLNTLKINLFERGFTLKVLPEGTKGGEYIKSTINKQYPRLMSLTSYLFHT